MSSTNRSNARELHASDYYVTPIETIKLFLDKFISIEGKHHFNYVLDPCAGGDEVNPMSYPEALAAFGVKDVLTVDIRENSRAAIKNDYLNLFFSDPFTVIITNPPFNIALEIIEKALFDVTDDGFVIMLLRLNFLGSQKRKPFWDANPPKYVFVHSKRISFFTDEKGNSVTDSIEYAHFVWQKNNKNPTQLYII
jgi:hypothetical protein